jgi:hypothetical protein
MAWGRPGMLMSVRENDGLDDCLRAETLVFQVAHIVLSHVYCVDEKILPPEQSYVHVELE